MPLAKLLERGHAARALAHREDNRSTRLEKMRAEVDIGDLLKFNDVRGDARSSRRILLLSDRPGILQATAYFAQAAKEAIPRMRREHVAEIGSRGRTEPVAVFFAIRNGPPAKHYSSREVFVRHLQKMTSTTGKEKQE